MNKKKLFIKNLQDIIDAENQFYNWLLSIEFKTSREEYKFNSSEMRFLLEVNDVSNYLRFYVSIKQIDKKQPASAGVFLLFFYSYCDTPNNARRNRLFPCAR